MSDEKQTVETAGALRNLTKLDDENNRLNDRQRLALEMMLQGRTLTDIAAKIGVSRQSISHWRNHDQDFIAELKRRRRAQFNGLGDRLRSLLDPAVNVIAEQLNDRYDRTRFRAASTLLKMANVKSLITDEDEQ